MTPRLTVMACSIALAITLATGRWLSKAQASQPVDATIIGCVLNGALIGGRQPGDSYVFRPIRGADRTPVDLSRFEGQRLEFTGMLYPGDHFHVRTDPRVLGACPAQKGT